MVLALPSHLPKIYSDSVLILLFVPITILLNIVRLCWLRPVGLELRKCDAGLPAVCALVAHGRTLVDGSVVM